MTQGSGTPTGNRRSISARQGRRDHDCLPLCPGLGDLGWFRPDLVQQDSVVWLGARHSAFRLRFPAAAKAWRGIGYFGGRASGSKIFSFDVSGVLRKSVQGDSETC